MVRPSDLVVWLKDVDRDDTHYVGEKNANLGELTQSGFLIPPGFVVTTTAYTQFIRENALERKISHLLATINYQDRSSVRQVSEYIKKHIVSAPFPDEISKKIFHYYKNIEKNTLTPTVAIRSSVATKNISPIDYHATFLNIQGEALLIHKIREAWASHFDVHALITNHEKKQSQLAAKISIGIEKMVDADTSGILFTIDPLTQNKKIVVIEAIYGLGIGNTHRQIMPDHYKIQKEDIKIVQKNISEQKTLIVKQGDQIKEIPVKNSLQSQQKISDSHIQALAKLAIKLEKHYFFPQDCEWAIERDILYLVQSRQITEYKKIESVTRDATASPILIGEPQGPGIATGTIRTVDSIKDTEKVQRGDIIITSSFKPEYTQVLKKAAAIIIQKEKSKTQSPLPNFTIPAVSGVPNVFKSLRDGVIATVNGRHGTIKKGGYTQTHHDSSVIGTPVLIAISHSQECVDNADGVGMFESNKLIQAYGIHPKKILKEKKSHQFIQYLADEISKVCQSMYPRRVVYQLSGLSTKEYHALSGGSGYEITESNPLLGYRGTYRHINDPKILSLELSMIAKVREQIGFNNLHVMTPFTRTVKELEQLKRHITAANLKRSPTFSVVFMVSTPANVLSLDAYLRAGIDEIIIDVDALATFALGVDFNNDDVTQITDGENPALGMLVRQCIETSIAKSTPVSVMGDIVSRHPNLAKKYVSWGAKSITVTPDALNITREYVGKIVKI